MKRKSDSRLSKTSKSLKSSKSSKASNNKMNTKSSKNNKPPMIDFSQISIDNNWVSASKTRNHLLKDPLIDWLHMYGISKGFREINHSSQVSFSSYIMNQGHQFESYIIDQLKTKFPSDFVEIDNTHYFPIQLKYRNQLQATYQAIQNGTPIIYQGLLCNPKNRTFGYPDLLIRSDYLGKIFDSYEIEESKTPFYVVVDIKFTTLKLKTDEYSLTSYGNIPAYKGQLYIYNQCLKYFQNYVPNFSYLLGRGWSTYKTSNIDNPFDKLASIDYSSETLSEDVDAAIEWITDLRSYGNDWVVYPFPSVPELYPNMCLEYDWITTKREISDNLGEITSLWKCGVEHREIAHSNKIFNWRDPRCSAETLGVTGKIIPSKLDRIIHLNRDSDQQLAYVKRENDEMKWKTDSNAVNIHMDFETVSNINQITSCSDRFNYIFMIGIEINGEYQSFIMDKLDEPSEKEMIQEFLKYLERYDKIRFYHYSGIEKNMFEKVLKKYGLTINQEIEWIDLLKIVENYRIIIQGCLNFSLKSLIYNLSRMNLIDVSYDNLEINNGGNAMINAFLAQQEIEVNNDESIETEVEIKPENQIKILKATQKIKDIEMYNRVDCISLKQLKEFLEENIN